MLNYLSTKCMYCQNDFDEKSEVVVCPDCGAPYHKSCYNEHSQCAFEKDHGTDNQWEGSKEIEAEKDEIFSSATEEQNSLQNLTEVFNKSNIGRDIDVRLDFSDRMGGLSPETKINDVPVSDLAAYVGASSNYYIPRFYLMANKKIKYAFNVSAGIMSVFWLSFRKMYKTFFMLLGIIIFINIPDIIIYYFETVAIYKDYDYFQRYNDYNPLLYSLPDFLSVLSTIATIFSYIILFYIFFNANKLYMNHAVKNVKKLRIKFSDDTAYHNALKSNGGTTIITPIVLAILVIVCVFGITFVAMGFDEIVNVLKNISV
jgi:Protein of unknown function (DUF2628).